MKYILRKLLTLIITLFIVSLLAFLAFQVIPGSPATSMLGTNATPEKVAQLEEEMGLDDPVLVRYGRWVADFVQGDWGESYSYNLPVKDMVLEKLPATAALVLLAFAITVAASFPLGIATARLMGASHLRIIFRHILPNTVQVLLPIVAIGFNNAVLAEASMSYLGVGVQPPDASLGRMLSEAQTYLGRAPWYALFVGLAIVLMILGLSLLTEGLQQRRRS